MNAALAQLLHNPLVWRGDQLAHAAHAVPSGFPDLDRELPGGGWPRSGLTELLVDDEGIGELDLVLPALAHLVQGGAWIALVAPPHLPHAPAFAGRGIDPARVVIITTTPDRHRWWAAEQVLRANSAGVLLFWPRTLNEQRLRRLQLAAQEGDAPAFVFAGAARAAHSSPAPLRIRLRAEAPCLRLDLFKRRGGVLSRPLLLDVRTTAAYPGRQVVPAATMNAKPSVIERLPAQRPPSFRRHYPVGAPQARIWNRALARADEVRRVPGPDPRGQQEASAAGLEWVRRAPAEAA
jgi:cell division inhibitor SulA